MEGLCGIGVLGNHPSFIFSWVLAMSYAILECPSNELINVLNFSNPVIMLLVVKIKNYLVKNLS